MNKQSTMTVKELIDYIENQEYNYLNKELLNFANDIQDKLKATDELLRFEDWCNNNTTTALNNGIKLALENYKKNQHE